MFLFDANQYRASFNTLQPKEKKYIEPEKKFNRHTFIRNVMRIKAVVMDVIELGKFIELVGLFFSFFALIHQSLQRCSFIHRIIQAD